MPKPARTESGKEGRAKLRQAFVVMPIRERGTAEHSHFQAFYTRFVKPALENHNYETIRADEIAQPGAITRDIVRNLHDADLVLADLTDINPNVFYELGIRHTLRPKGTILILDISRTPNIPFDVSQQRVIRFRGEGAEGLGTFTEDLKRCLAEIGTSVPGDGSNDSPVYDWLPVVPSTSESRTRQSRHGWNPSGNGAKATLVVQESERAHPEDVIAEALREAESGLLPKDILNEAQHVVSRGDMTAFLNCLQKFLDVKAFEPSDREFAEMYYLAKRIDARSRVTRALLEIGLRNYPDSDILLHYKVSDLAHSSNSEERHEAKQLVARLLSLDLTAIRDDGLSLEVLHNAGQHDLLALMLDAYHRDGEDHEALEITAKLKELYPNSSLALRNHARALEKNGGREVDEIVSAYRDAVICPDVDATSAIWYASTLNGAGRYVDSVETLLFGCTLDLDDAKCYARLAEEISTVLQPQNVHRMRRMNRALPVYCDESYVRRCISLCMSCPNYGMEEKFSCERAMRNVGIDISQIEAAYEEEGDLSRRDRQEFILPLYDELKSAVTENVA